MTQPAPGIPLFVTKVFELNDERPMYLRTVENGATAYQGLLLLDAPSEERVQHLLACRKRNLWEFGPGNGITSADSALVLEGLMACDVPRAVLEPSFETLRDMFFDSDASTFSTVLTGRAGYWRGPCLDASAHLGFLMHVFEPKLYAEEILGCLRFVGSAQNDDGTWSSKWFPSFAVPSYYAIRFLVQQRSEQEAQKRWLDHVVQAQSSEGHWSHSIIDTAATLLAMAHVDSDLPESIVAQERGRAWLARTWSGGELSLYYWFAHGMGGGAGQDRGAPFRRLMFLAQDKGAVTHAWRSLALRGYLGPNRP